MKEIRTMSTTSLRNLCIERNWYTRGDNRDYRDLFDYVEYANKTGITTEKLEGIANDIIRHCSSKVFKDCAPNGITPLQYVMCDLAEICHSRFEEEPNDKEDL